MIHCSAGVSRSAAVVATALASVEEICFEEALSQVKEEKPDVNPAPELRTLAKNYLDL